MCKRRALTIIDDIFFQSLPLQSVRSFTWMDEHSLEQRSISNDTHLHQVKRYHRNGNFTHDCEKRVVYPHLRSYNFSFDAEEYENSHVRGNCVEQLHLHPAISDMEYWSQIISFFSCAIL